MTSAVEVVESCPLCRASQSTLFDRRLFRGQPVTNRLCTYCGLVYQSPRMTAMELEAFYQAEYRQLYQGSQEPTPKDLAVQQGRAQALIEFIRPVISAVNNHLDIGCSAGLLLRQAQKVYTCQSVGVEPGDAYRQAAALSELKVYSSLAELEAAGKASFDLISMAHVLEHLADPIEYLAHLRQNLLDLDGWLLIEVPNLYGHDCFEVAHLISYSPHTLRQVLAQAGFQVAELRTHGLPRSTLIPLYISVVAQAAPAPGSSRPIPEKAVRSKRQVALIRRGLQERLFRSKAWLPVPGAAIDKEL